jgi:hypothetical protein
MRKNALIFGIAIVLIGCNDKNTFLENNLPVTYLDKLLKEKADSSLTEKDTNGNLISKCYYKAGLKHGYCEYYFENNQIEEEGSYYHGNPIGLFTYYNKDGSIKEIREYEIVQGKSVINQFQRFNNDSIIDEKSNYISLTAKDTIKLGDKYNLRIKLEAPYFKSKMDVIIGNFDIDYNLIDSLNYSTFHGNNFIVNYNIEPKKLGQNVIRGFVKDYQEYKDSDTIRAARTIYFTKIFFVDK